MYDVGEEVPSAGSGQAVAYLVMQYLEGQTLADRLTKGPIPLEPALQYAIQMADALDIAHRHGIVHRDLKPGNIMLTKAGIKLLDFGLAKTGVTGMAGSSMSMLPTTPANVTAAGTILGTFQYMAPEQLEGLEADARTDIFAFGTVLYEMLTGRKAFEGRSQASLIGAILEREPPPITTLQPAAPPALDHVVRTCLAKDPDNRFHTAHDLLVQLKWILETGSQTAARISRVTRVPWTRRLLIPIAAALAAATVTGAGVWMLKPEPPRPVRRFAILPPEGLQFAQGTRAILAVSPDATHLVYVGSAPNLTGGQLYLRATDEFIATPILGTLGSQIGVPFFSPDGQWLGFWQNGQLKKVAITGGAPLELCQTPPPFGATWTSDGVVLFGRGPDGIWQVSAGGGQPSRLVSVDPKTEIAFGPQMLPGGKAVLFTLASQALSVSASSQALWDNAQIVVQSLESGERTVVVRGGSDARYVATGHIVYVRQGALLAIPFDPTRRAASGPPVPLVEGIQQAIVGGGVGFGGSVGAAQFAVSQNGLLAYIPQDATPLTRMLVWVDRQGRETPLSLPERSYAYPRISPDGTRIALDVRDQEQDIWIWQFARETLTRFTFDPTADVLPVWTPDGRRIAFFRNGQGIFWKAADGTGPEERLTASGSELHGPTAFSRDGTRLLFYDNTAQGYDIKMLRLEGKAVVDLLVQPTVNETNPDTSPDGRWLAYQSNESGQNEIYVRPFPDVQAGRWQISRAGGTRPLWARDSRELYYLAPDGAMMAVTVESSATFQAGNPTKLFAGPYFVGLNGRTYDVSADGQRFLMIKNAGSTVASTPRILVVENWFEELKRRVPVK